jgi:hypothetical protein
MSCHGIGSALNSSSLVIPCLSFSYCIDSGVIFDTWHTHLHTCLFPNSNVQYSWADFLQSGEITILQTLYIIMFIKKFLLGVAI